jgi:CubicO group peptidase (beta-lactamase class C family)
MRRLLLIAFLASLLFGRMAAADDRFPGAAWDHVPPAQSGWSEALLAGVQEGSKQIGSTAFMVVHRGAVVAEWGDTVKRTELASVRKSLLSALIGIAVAERKISLDSTLAQLGIDDNPPQDEVSRVNVAI